MRKSNLTKAPAGKSQRTFEAAPTKAQLLEPAKFYYAQGADLHWLQPARKGVKNSGKAPIERQWNCKPARHTLKALMDSYLPGYNLGMCCAVHNRIVVLDVDFGNHRQDKAIEEQLKRLGVAARDCQVHTGSGGLHYYCTWPKAAPLPATQMLWFGGPHCEIRLMGVGSNVVLSPSWHWSGKRYRFRFGAAIGKAPKFLVKAAQTVKTGIGISPAPATTRLDDFGMPYHQDLEDAARLLLEYGNTDVEWANYIAVMLALQNTFGDDALGLFLDWASSSDKFDEKTSRLDWARWGKSKSKRYTYGSLVHLCTQNRE